MTDIIGSSIPLEGKVVNINGYFTDSFNLYINYDVKQLSDSDNFATYIVYDGIIVDKNTTENQSNIIIEQSGNHSLLVERSGYNNPVNSFIRYANGSNVYLDWKHSTSPDTYAYNIYKDNVLIDTVKDVEVDKKEMQRTSAGGRYTVYGTTDEYVNDNFTVAFGTNSFTFNGNSYDFFGAGISYKLDYGITLILHDKPDSYSDFDIFIGVKSYVVLKNQPAGTNNYKVEAIDKAGNKSTQLQKSVYVQKTPADISIDLDTGVVTTDWNINETINVYSNELPSITLDYIYTDAPIQILTQSNNVINALSYDSKFYLFPVVDGLEHKNINLYVQPNPLIIEGVLNVPADLSVIPIAGGNFEIRWTYEKLENDKAHHFNIYRYNDYDDTWTIANFDNILITDNIINNYGYITDYSYSFNYQFGNGISIKFKIAAADSADVEGDFSAVSSAIADATAPVITGSLSGANL